MRKTFKEKPGYKSWNPLNFFSSNLLFEVGESTSLGQLEELYLEADEFEVDGDKLSVLKDLASHEITVHQKTQEDAESSKAKKKLSSAAPVFPILRKFEESKGIFNLINVALAVVKTYKDEKQRATWTLWLEELKSFCELPNFFNLFAQDFSSASTVYELIDGKLEVTLDTKQPQIEKNLV